MVRNGVRPRGRGKAYLNIPDEKIIKYLNPTPGPLSMLFLSLHSYYFTFKCKNVSMLFPLPSSHIISHIISSICEKCLCSYSHSVRKLLDVPRRYKLFVPKFVSTLAKMSHNVKDNDPKLFLPLYLWWRKSVFLWTYLFTIKSILCSSQTCVLLLLVLAQFVPFLQKKNIFLVIVLLV